MGTEGENPIADQGDSTEDLNENLHSLEEPVLPPGPNAKKVLREKGKEALRRLKEKERRVVKSKAKRVQDPQTLEELELRDLVKDIKNLTRDQLVKYSEKYFPRKSSDAMDGRDIFIQEYLKRPPEQ